MRAQIIKHRDSSHCKVKPNNGGTGSASSGELRRTRCGHSLNAIAKEDEPLRKFTEEQA
jgi:hypothetical protein